MHIIMNRKQQYFPEQLSCTPQRCRGRRVELYADRYTFCVRREVARIMFKNT